MPLKIQKFIFSLVIFSGLFFIFSDTCYSTKALIWKPDEEHAYGHAAILTDKYYMSFWPRDNISGFLHQAETYLDKVPGSLVLEPEFDIENEGKEPLIYDLGKNISQERINSAYEELLRKNAQIIKDTPVSSLKRARVSEYNIDVCGFNDRARIHNRRAEYWRNSCLRCFCSNKTKSDQDLRLEYSNQELIFPKYSVVSNYDSRSGWLNLDEIEHSCTTFATTLLAYGAQDSMLGINYKTTSLQWLSKNKCKGVASILKPAAFVLDNLIVGPAKILLPFFAEPVIDNGRIIVDNMKSIIITVPDFERMIRDKLGAQPSSVEYKKRTHMNSNTKKKRY
jgi:hypothetical protein